MDGINMDWHVSGVTNADISDSDGYIVAKVCMPSIAPMVAAAPDMLEALEEAIGWLSQNAPNSVINKVDEAIEKARGE